MTFGLVGALATLSHYAAMFTGLMFWDQPVFWSFLGAVLGAGVGYILNYLYTFKSTLPHRHTTRRYAVITLLSILLNTSVFYVLAVPLGLPVLAAQMLSTLLVFMCNFLAHKYITFDERTVPSP